MTNELGYRNVVLYKNGFGTEYKVHRLVAIAFCENPNNYNVVDHKNGRKLDNRANNLRWVTQKENIQNAKINGHDYTKQPTTGTHNGKKTIIFCEELNKTFETCRKAAEYLKTVTGIETPLETMKKNIHRACTNNKTAYRYHWKFN